MPAARSTVCTASPNTSQLEARSAFMRAASASILASPRPSAFQATSEWPNATPRLRSTVESVRSRCQRDNGSLSAKWRSNALAPAQVAERDVTPHVATQVDADDIDGGERIAVLGDPVVRLDLRGPGVVFKVEGRDEGAGERRPVDSRQRGIVRVEVADRAVPLAEDRHGAEAPLGARKTRS